MHHTTIPILPIADLHCDLLSYLSRNSTHTAFDSVVRCSIPQLQTGGVKFQTMAISALTEPGSSARGRLQMEIYKNLPKLYPGIFEHTRLPTQLTNLNCNQNICILPAIENASSICDEVEEVKESLKILSKYLHKIGKPLYVSLTWNTENRFGGGCSTTIGLKNDGKILLDYLCEHKIPIDFSHASDNLATDIINYIDKQGYKIPLLASHSNIRSIIPAPRNLPDELVKEILNRQGIIGLNFIRHFIGEAPSHMCQHLARLLQLKGENGACLGADFYWTEELPIAFRNPLGSFFPDYDHAGSYQKVVDMWHKNLYLNEATLKKISYENLVAFITKHILGVKNGT